VRREALLFPDGGERPHLFVVVAAD